MKAFSLVLSSAVVSTLMLSAPAQSQTRQGAGAGGSSYFTMNNAPSPIGMTRENPKPHKVIHNKATGKTYEITYLPSGRSQIAVNDGGLYLYNPHNGELTAIKPSS